MLNKKSSLLFVFFILILLSNIFAYQISPMTQSFSPTGAESAKVYTITNDSDSPIAVQVKAVKRIVNKDGTETTEDAPAYFSIQPAKVIIKANTSQIVRVQYRGPKTVNKEMNFRIIFEQIPYSTGAQQTSGQMINFLFVYSTSAYVNPSKNIVKINSSLEKVDDKVQITITNDGSVHQILDNLTVTIKGKNDSYKLTDEELGAIKGSNLLTDSSFVITLDKPEIFTDDEKLSVSVEYNK